MDPHSRRSQFNAKRGPRAGPLQTMPYALSPKPIPVLDKEKSQKRPSATRKSSTSSVLLSLRPIATNSRVKLDEQLKKDMYLTFVNNALHQQANGDSEMYDQLVDQFNMKRQSGDAPSPVPQLRLWLLALSHVVSRLERKHSTLVEAIVNMPWTTMDSSFVKTYSSFTGMLVSARPEYLSLVLGKLAQGFTYQSGLKALDANGPESSSNPLTRRDVYDRLHYLLRHVLGLIPTLSSTLQPFLVQNFPHKRENLVTQVTYIRNILQISQYCPELADKIMATVIDRSIQIDVEIQVELEELEEVAGDTTEELFDVDPFDVIVGDDFDESESDSEEEGADLSDISSDAGDPDEDELSPPPTQTDEERTQYLSQVQDMVRKLDSILKLIFDHFNNTHAATSVARTARTMLSRSTSRSDSPLSVANSDDTFLVPRPPSPPSLERERALRRSQFHCLLSIFDRTIIRTFKSRYTQFLVFWYSSLDPEFSDLFQGMLISRALLETDQPPVTRAAATAYIASFVSRARFVDGDGARQVVALLCDYLRNQLDVFDAGGALPDKTQHTMFYAVAQAVFLVFCFRWRDLLARGEQEDADELVGAVGSASSRKWMSELDVIHRVVHSSLNPLKVCSSNVVMQFARVAHATNFVYCYPILEANRRMEHGASAAPQPRHHPRIIAGLSEVVLDADLNTFFPFDPYDLPKSSPYIQGVYRQWSAVAIEEDGDDEEDEDGDGDGDGDGVDDADADALSWSTGSLAIPKRAEAQDDGGLGVSLGAMSISPIQAPVAAGIPAV